MKRTTLGLPKHVKNYSLAYFEYFATCEGVTIKAEMLNYEDQQPSFAKDWPEEVSSIIKRIPVAIAKTFEGKKYLDWNPEFKIVFYETFGCKLWDAFVHVCMNNKNALDLKIELYYNLS